MLADGRNSYCTRITFHDLLLGAHTIVASTENRADADRSKRDVKRWLPSRGMVIKQKYTKTIIEYYYSE
jgi:hypothetical protein